MDFGTVPRDATPERLGFDVTTGDSGYERLHLGARWYAEHGWKILPCYGLTETGKCTCNQTHTDPKDIGKHPQAPNWQNAASSDLNQIDAWWRADPRYNVGVMARNSGFFVLDVDPRSGGDDSYYKFEELVNGAIPKTVEAITGVYSVGGKAVRGRHLFIKVDENESLHGNLKYLNLPGIDVKHRGYVLLNPSRHVSGVTYEWKPGHAPWEIEMAEAPEELLSVLRKRATSSGDRSGSGRSGRGDGSDWGWISDLEFNGGHVDLDKLTTEGIDEGSRAVDIYAMACALANKYGTDPMNRQFIETLMLRFNHEKVRPPLEVDGPNSLLMHVHRAIDFVAANPKIAVQGAMGSAAAEWARNRQQETNSAFTPPQVYTTSDPDDDQSYVNTTASGTIGGIMSAAALNGSSIHDAARFNNGAMPKDPDALTAEEGGDPLRRTLTDTGNGRRLVDSFGSAIRYSPGLGWFHWTGSYWRPDAENLDIRELAKRIAPVIASEVIHYEDPQQQQKVVKWSNDAKSNARLGNAIESATSDPRVIVPVESWDSNVEQLGVHNGVIDLRTGELLRGRPDLYITRRAPVSYTPGIKNKRWDDFLDYGTGGDLEYKEWLQKVAGYTLTGLRTHDAMFLVYGPPGSGKNVLVESLVKVLGTQQYAWPMDSQILAQGDGHANAADLYHWAELRGRRMIWVDELPESERLKENSVKKLTGSNEISARSPGEKPFTFSSRGKLWITTNHRPIITDDAMWRRIRPIPWLNTPKVIDPGLKDYLFDAEGGLPAVLAWAVEGAMKVINSKEQDSLGWCKVVSEAAEVYRKNEDRIGMFLDEETVSAPGLTLPMKAVYPVYQMWSENRGEKPMSQIALHRKLSDRGVQINGQGARAEIIDRGLITHTANAGFDFASMSRIYNR